MVRRYKRETSYQVTATVSRWEIVKTAIKLLMVAAPFMLGLALKWGSTVILDAASRLSNLLFRRRLR